jgi:hypothetical protein
MMSQQGCGGEVAGAGWDDQGEPGLDGRGRPTMRRGLAAGRRSCVSDLYREAVSFNTDSPLR